MIKIICGTCGTSKGNKTEKDGWLTLPPVEEARLVKRKVAVFANSIQQIRENDAKNTVGVLDAAEAAENAAKVQQEDEVADYEELEDLSLNELKTIAKGLNIPTTKCRSKAAAIEAIKEATNAAIPSIVDVIE